MKKICALLIIAMAIVWTAATPAPAEEMKTFTIDSAVKQIDKNGNPYVRLITTENRQLNGIAYEATVPVMAFGSELVSQAEKYTPGKSCTAIVNKRVYQGRDSYTVLAFVAQPAKAAKP